MFINLDETGTSTGLKETIDLTLQNQGISGLILLTCEDNGYSSDEIDPVLQKVSVPLCGGIFPSLIYGDRKLDRGTIVIGLSGYSQARHMPHLSRPDTDYESVIDSLLPDLSKAKTVVIFVDIMSKNISSFMDGLFNVLGMEANYIGGGAGSKTLEKKPCVFTNDGMVRDSAVMMFTELKSDIEISQGWHSVSPPLQVTESEGNIIKTLDWRPALDVYSEIIESHTGTVPDMDSFFESAMLFPLGIARIDSERIVRDIISTGDDKSLVSLSEIPTGAFVEVLTSDNQTLTEATKIPVKSNRKTIFLMCCISCVNLLKKDFRKVLKAVSGEGSSVVGACTLGEIANNGNECLEIYNKTTVMGVLYHEKQ